MKLKQSTVAKTWYLGCWQLQLKTCNYLFFQWWTSHHNDYILLPTRSVLSSKVPEKTSVKVCIIPQWVSPKILRSIFFNTLNFPSWSPVIITCIRSTHVNVSRLYARRFKTLKTDHQVMWVEIFAFSFYFQFTNTILRRRFKICPPSARLFWSDHDCSGVMRG